MGLFYARLAPLLATLSISYVAAFHIANTFPKLSFSTQSKHRYMPMLLATMSNSDNKKPLSAANRERREEDKRRKDRTGDVIIGKTSAKVGETDYALDVAATEQEWLRQATNVEREIFLQTEKGLKLLKMFQLEESLESFDRVFELKPDAYLWQAGIVKYYLGDLKGAADIFARNAQLYESRFFDPASEERIWRHACEIKLLSQFSKKERKQALGDKNSSIGLTQIPQRDQETEFLQSESRKAIRITRELFEATVERNYSNTILSRAKLRSIGGAFEQEPRIDVKMWKLNSWFYLGLHYDALGEIEESKKCMKMALRLSPSGNGSDLIHTLPMLHMSQRDWFDEDGDFEADLFNSSENHGRLVSSNQVNKLKDVKVGVGKVDADPVLVDSIKESLSKLRLMELQDALRLRGVRAVGSKLDLRDRLFQSLMDDAGLLP